MNISVWPGSGGRRESSQLRYFFPLASTYSLRLRARGGEHARRGHVGVRFVVSTVIDDETILIHRASRTLNFVIATKPAFALSDNCPSSSYFACNHPRVTGQTDSPTQARTRRAVPPSPTLPAASLPPPETLATASRRFFNAASAPTPATPTGCRLPLDTENSARTISATHTPSFPPSHPPTSVSTRTFHPCRRTPTPRISTPTLQSFLHVSQTQRRSSVRTTVPPTRTTHRAFYRGTPPVSSPARAPVRSSALKNSSVASDTTPETNRTTIPTIPTIPTPSSTPPTRPTAPHASSDASPIAFDDASSTSSSSSPSSSETYPKRRSSFGTPSRASSSSIDAPASDDRAETRAGTVRVVTDMSSAAGRRAHADV